MAAMNSMTMPMSVSMPTAYTTSANMATTATTAQPREPTSTDSLDSDMGGMRMGGCKVSMLWNWYTIDSCFLSHNWKIKSAADFTGLCFGVILMAIALQFLGWAARFYDRRLVRHHEFKAIAAATAVNVDLIPQDEHHSSPSSLFRPNLWEQLARTAIRTMQFALAYWIMLMAMYYNGYIIICIIIGTFIGTYMFRWERLGGLHGAVPGGHSEPTGCCG